jgi:hypothetical protein
MTKEKMTIEELARIVAKSFSELTLEMNRRFDDTNKRITMLELKIEAVRDELKNDIKTVEFRIRNIEKEPFEPKLLFKSAHGGSLLR